MNETQFYISVAVMPTIVIVLLGVLLNNNNMSNRINDLRDLLRAEMAKNHSELLAKFAELGARLSRLEARVGG